MIGDWEALQAKHVLRVQSLALAFSSVQAPLVNTLPLGASQVLVPPTPCQFKWSLALGHVGEYAHITKAFALLALAPTS